MGMKKQEVEVEFFYFFFFFVCFVSLTLLFFSRSFLLAAYSPAPLFLFRLPPFPKMSRLAVFAVLCESLLVCFVCPGGVASERKERDEGGGRRRSFVFSTVVIFFSFASSTHSSPSKKKTLL